MTGRQNGQKWIAPAVIAVLSLIVALLPQAAVSRNNVLLAVILFHLLLPVVTAMTGALQGWPLTGVLCVFAAVAGFRAFPAEALPVTLFWCAASGLTACVPFRNRLMRPAFRTGMCLAAWGIGLFILMRLTGGQIVNGLAKAACDYVDHSPDSTSILLQAYNAGYVRLQGTEALMPAVRVMGSVVNQAFTMLPAMPQRTFLALLADPAPMIAVLMTWVVDTGAPSAVIVSMAMAEDSSATQPSTGSSLVMPLPTVFMMRWPPMEVPSAMQVAHETLTHRGTPEPAATSPLVMRASVMMPMVFWASLLPWL